jgi:glutamate-1-semialdehyde aminotransferase
LSQFVDALLDCGVRITTRGTWFLSTAHTKADVEETLAAARKAMLALPKSDDRHTGRPTIAGEISR